MPKLIMSNGPTQVITFPELFLMGVITRIPGEVDPSHFATKEATQTHVYKLLSARGMSVASLVAK